MEISILLFGIARDIVGDRSLTLEVKDDCKVEELKRIIVEKFPKFEHLANISIAVNNEYARNYDLLKMGDEVALIPPVSGG